MTRRKVDQRLVDRALDMRDEGRPVVEILDETGLSQGTYYAYLHERESAVEQAYVTQSIAPMLTWPGSKRNELDELLPFVPEYTGRYVEPFLGGGAMFFALKPDSALLSDASPELVSFYGAVRDRCHLLHGELAAMEAEYAAADEEGKRALYGHARDVLNGAIAGGRGRTVRRGRVLRRQQDQLQRARAPQRPRRVQRAVGPREGVPRRRRDCRARPGAEECGTGVLRLRGIAHAVHGR